jgi:MoaA/NifB/PqqE/SkfB family radical SAM enzyme
MDLILKPTEACNFKCTFCSSTSIAPKDIKLLDILEVYKFLDEHPDTTTIIVNGGDPLMVKPQYYWDIIKYLDDHDMNTTLSFTSNLWPFYIKPEKWTKLFNHWRLGITTSFQYGDGRLHGDYSIYTDKDFWKVSDKMLELVGYRPDFITVVVDGEQDKAIDNVRLAKEMGVECKLNYAMASGDQAKPLLLSDIYTLYTEIYDLGLMEWEYNTKDIIKSMRKEATSCPRNRKCEEGIRAIQPAGDQYTCGSFADDMEYPITGPSFREDPDLLSMNNWCFTCPLFELCNGCAKTIKDHKRFGMQEEHCKQMKILEPKLLEMRDSY